MAKRLTPPPASRPNKPAKNQGLQRKSSDPKPNRNIGKPRESKKGGPALPHYPGDPGHDAPRR